MKSLWGKIVYQIKFTYYLWRMKMCLEGSKEWHRWRLTAKELYKKTIY